MWLKNFRPNSVEKRYSIGRGSKGPTQKGRYFGNVFLKHLEILKYLPVLTTVVLKLLIFNYQINDSSTATMKYESNQ